MSNNAGKSTSVRLTLFGVGLFLVFIGLGVLFNISLAETASRVFTGTISIIIAIAGLGAIGTAFFMNVREGWSRAYWFVLGVIYLALAGAIWDNPGATAEFITVLIAGLFVLAGLVKFVMAYLNQHRTPYWGLSAVMGIITFFFGVFVLAHWPAISMPFIGMYVALEILSTGLNMIMSGLAYE